MRVGLEGMVRQLRSKVWKEFLEVPTTQNGTKEKTKKVAMPMRRQRTNRAAMALSQPLSPVTGSVWTNVGVESRPSDTAIK